MATLVQNPTENLTENQVETPLEQKIWTDAEFMALNRDGHRYEIVNGELIDRETGVQNTVMLPLF